MEINSKWGALKRRPVFIVLCPNPTGSRYSPISGNRYHFIQRAIVPYSQVDYLLLIEWDRDNDQTSQQRTKDLLQYFFISDSGDVSPDDVLWLLVHLPEIIPWDERNRNDLLCYLPHRS